MTEPSAWRESAADIEERREQQIQATMRYTDLPRLAATLRVDLLARGVPLTDTPTITCTRCRTSGVPWKESVSYAGRDYCDMCATYMQE